MTTFEIYFTDLTNEAQEVLLKSVGFKDKSEGNWDILPITTIEFDIDKN